MDKSTKRPSELDIQDRVADAIWFVPQSDDAQAHYVLEYSGRSPKAYLNLWLGKEFGEELTEWNWVLHNSAVELWRRESTDEEIIEVLLPANELLAQNERLLSDIERWNATIAVGRERAEQMETVIEAARNLDAHSHDGYGSLVSYLIRLHEALVAYDANKKPLPDAFTSDA